MPFLQIRPRNSAIPMHTLVLAYPPPHQYRRPASPAATPSPHHPLRTHYLIPVFPTPTYTYPTHIYIHIHIYIHFHIHLYAFIFIYTSTQQSRKDMTIRRKPPEKKVVRRGDALAAHWGNRALLKISLRTLTLFAESSVNY